MMNRADLLLVYSAQALPLNYSNSTATDAATWLELRAGCGVSTCTYELYTLQMKERDHVFRIHSDRVFVRGSSTPCWGSRCGYESMARTRASS
ncbi:hypothetical protein EVAR_31319_1 [Eumeta japonica]|uniref:Uncharacterized protein n=1 Tax=Eumeta variegata TaxID=151549 RepID=A0A4C1Y188_EUMVA|nr:hypothetical protein EVAR_31319_1 [Eumeta japonica]